MNETGAGTAPVDLTNCDREPIHIPGAIQPFGFLLATGADWVIVRAANTHDHIGVEPAQVLGISLGELILPNALRQIRQRVAILRDEDSVERLFSVDLIEGLPPFDVAVHCSRNSIVIECEPATGDEIEVSSLVRGLIQRLGAAPSTHALLREGARQLRTLTGFDRVMVYRFAENGSGEVVAEALGARVDSFMGLHFPATDIPRQARVLYLRNIFRIIADVEDRPRAVEPLDADPLDLSLSLFRAVSPIHIEYLRNMGVRASLSVSIIIDGRLWGLFACHHYAPRLPSFAERSAAELFGQMFSLLLESKLRTDEQRYEEQARKVADRLLATAARDSQRLSDADWLCEIMMDAIPADGVGVAVDGRLSSSGLTPDEDEIRALADVVSRESPGDVFTTSRITDILPAAKASSSRAAGVLAIPISRRPRDYVMLFRSEKLRSVRWAGNQEKEVEHGPNGPRLTPRKSFEEWSELVRGEATPFSPAEVRVAETLRTTLLEVLLRLTESASEERRRSGEQQKLLIAELNHRVRNILALIRALLGQTSREETDIASFTQTLDARIQALARSHDQLTADRWGPARLKELIATEASAYLHQDANRVEVKGTDVTITPEAFTVMALVVHEMMTNATKYGALSDGGTVRVSWTAEDDGSLGIVWEEIGGPAVMPPKRRGFGTTIICDSIPHELGGEADVSYRTAGLLARFRLPARYVAGIAEASQADPTAAVAGSDGRTLIQGKRVLLVEDSTLIALDAEDRLYDLGAAEVVLAASNAAAAKAIAAQSVDVAMLDFNLGRENSVPTAERLRAAGIPFLFASGYGGEDTIPEDFQSVPVVVKPYASEQIILGFAKIAPVS